jgi:cysteine desulfurase / selenocysteine lyase
MNFFDKSNCYRDLIVGTDTTIPLPNGNKVTAINFDNAATTPPLKAVINALNEFAPWYSSIHRGIGYKSSLTTNLYDTSRAIVGNFVKADLSKDIVIYVKNTTEAINKLANRLCTNKHACVVLTTEMEHHSNILPWQSKCKTDFVSIDKYGQLSLHDLENKLIQYNGKVKLVAVTGASNVTGLKNPIHEIAELCHKHAARIVVDGAQLVPHCDINMLPSNHKAHIDFLVFSSHKLYSPFGIGVLIGPKSDFDKGSPDYSGGGTVKLVTKDFVSWEEPPSKDEAGTPNIMGVLALTTAIKVLSEIGMDKIADYESFLTKYALARLTEIPDIILYGVKKTSNYYSNSIMENRNISLGNNFNTSYSHNVNMGTDDLIDRIGIIPFNIAQMEHETVAKALAYESGISVRNGCFCAHPYIQKLLKNNRKQISYLTKHIDTVKNLPGMVRISFGMYNTPIEIDTLIDGLKTISKNKEYYNKKYL